MIITRGDCKDCKDGDRMNTAPFLENEITRADPITDMENYLHTILDNNDPETMKYKCDHNDELMNNTQLQIIHKGQKSEID